VDQRKEGNSTPITSSCSRGEGGDVPQIAEDEEISRRGGSATVRVTEREPTFGEKKKKGVRLQLGP